MRILRLLSASLIAGLLLSASPAFAADAPPAVAAVLQANGTIRVQWEPSPTPCVAKGGYIVNVGTASRVYDSEFGAGISLTFTFTPTEQRTWYFAVKAFCIDDNNTMLKSDFSNEAVSFPSPIELCLADGTGNLIDDDMDGLIDEICLPRVVVPPPPPDPCILDPLIVTGVKWPAQNSGSRSLTFGTGTKKWLAFEVVWRSDGHHTLTVHDTRSCSAMVRK